MNSAKPALLVDARNALYRAIYATKHDKRFDVKYHYFVIFLRQLTSWIRRYDPVSVHVFWDAPRATVWRREMAPKYKDRDNSQYIEDISEELASTTTVAQAFLEKMAVRQYSRKRMEADDLIYSAVAALHPIPTVIVSTDSDMVQIPYRFNSSTVFHPQKQEEVDVPNVDPVMQKALVGDKADSIAGYKGIGPVKSSKMLADPAVLEEFLKGEDRKIFGMNMALIDLSLNPFCLANKLYVLRRLAEEVEFSKSDIDALTRKYKVNGLMQEYSNLIPPFKKLA
jgi:5'-3' exonuclease